jgi:CheY-like chemotaxis protein
MLSLKILVVEDHGPTNQAMVKVLGSRGHVVTGAKSMAEAVEFANKNQYDLVISDIGLPDGNGWDMLAEVKRENPQVQAIALTGHGYARDLERSASAGFADHITKPVAMAKLERSIRRLFPEA